MRERRKTSLNIILYIVDIDEPFSLNYILSTATIQKSHIVNLGFKDSLEH